MDDKINQINEYINKKGVSPYSIWLGRTKDKKTRAKIIARVDRLALNNFGDAKSVGEGVSELRIHFAIRVLFLVRPGAPDLVNPWVAQLFRNVREHFLRVKIM